MDIFSHLIVMFVWKDENKNEKEAGDGRFRKKEKHDNFKLVPNLILLKRFLIDNNYPNYK